MKHAILHFAEPVFEPESRQIQYLQRTCKNKSRRSVLLKDSIYLKLSLPDSYDRLVWYHSGWAREFTRQESALSESFSFANEKGRCSAECAPFFTLMSRDSSLDFAICTSGNYKVELCRKDGRTVLIVSNPDRDFCTMLPPGALFSYPGILSHRYVSQEECYRVKQSRALAALSDHPFYRQLPVIYNHWWAYEDQWINEDIILDNARIAANLGAEMLVLDAGWFGHDDPGEEAFHVRGDWDHVNKSRFPRGLAWLREQLAQLGLSMGIWCEPETVDAGSELIKNHPEWLAVRNGKRLPYLCFSIPEVQEWAYKTMKNLFRLCTSVYWKLDFNIDPGFGCNAPGHCHDSGNGLLKHYEGLYRVLDRLRREFPELVIENCSSGGQRLNLEMGLHTHLHFLSDADHSVHQMHLFKEASKWFLPKQLLHFMWSGTRTPHNPLFPSLNLDSISPKELHYHMRLAMLHPFGISHRLTEYSPATLSLMKDYLTEYKDIIRPYIAGGIYLPLYLSEYVNVFSYTKGTESLIFLFAQEPEAISFSLRPLCGHGLSHGYTLTDMDMREEVPLGDTRYLTVSFTPQCRWTSRLFLFSH